MATLIEVPKVDVLLAPLLASLPGAAVSIEPPTIILPLLSPILRQRVQILSTSTSEPWIHLLCYDDEVALKLKTIASSPQLELHPVSGQVEIDWQHETRLQYKRLDSETMHAQVSLYQLGLTTKLLWCTSDDSDINHGDNWRICEVCILDKGGDNWGVESLSLAEEEFFSNKAHNTDNGIHQNIKGPLTRLEIDEEKEEDDDQYWAQYNNTPVQTPVQKQIHTQSNQSNGENNLIKGEEEYYANYNIVQPAMDNYDPDEAVEYIMTGSRVITRCAPDTSSINECRYSSQSLDYCEAPTKGLVDDSSFTTKIFLQRPYAERNMITSKANAVADNQAVSSESAIKIHIGASLKSLFRLARAAGIETREFDRIVRNQLDLINLIGEDGEDR